MSAFCKAIGRIKLEVSEDGLKMHDYGHGCDLSIADGWNGDSKFIANTLSIDELRDLQYLVQRAIETAKK